MDAAKLCLMALKPAHVEQTSQDSTKHAQSFPSAPQKVRWPVMMATTCHRNNPYLHFSAPLIMTFQGSVAWNSWPRVQDWGVSNSMQVSMIFLARSAISMAKAVTPVRSCLFGHQSLVSGRTCRDSSNVDMRIRPEIHLRRCTTKLPLGGH